MVSCASDEVSRDEAEALEALSNFWIQNVVKAQGKKKPISAKDKLFYETYCNGTETLKIEVAARLMRCVHKIIFRCNNDFGLKSPSFVTFPLKEERGSSGIKGQALPTSDFSILSCSARGRSDLLLKELQNKTIKTNKQT